MDTSPNKSPHTLEIPFFSHLPNAASRPDTPQTDLSGVMLRVTGLVRLAGGTGVFTLPDRIRAGGA